MATITRQQVISLETSHHGSDSISISLQDTGPGIDPNKLTSIFDPFVTTKANGTGLGLAICKMIIEHHGGKLSAASDMHDGARFEVTLPTNIPAALAPHAGSANDSTGLAVKSDAESVLNRAIEMSASAAEGKIATPIQERKWPDS